MVEQQRMSPAEYSRHRGVTRQTVTRWKHLGKLVMGGGRVDVEATDRVLDARPPKFRGGTASRRIGDETKAAETNPPEFAEAAPWTTAEAQRRKECALAQLRELELATKYGELVKLVDIQPVWSRSVLAARSHILAIPTIAKLRLQLSDAQTHELMQIIREQLTAAAFHHDRAPAIEATNDD